jgi:hypothetical protein
MECERGADLGREGRRHLDDRFGDVVTVAAQPGGSSVLVEMQRSAPHAGGVVA